MKTVKSLLPFAVLGALTASAHAGGVEISEIRIDSSPVDEEFFELSGAPGTSLAGIWYVVIGDGSAADGAIEAAIDLSAESIQADGLFVCADDGTDWTGACLGGGTVDLFTGLSFENGDNVTHMLVTDFTGAVGDDIDDDDDGVPNAILPWTSIVDSIALVEHPDGTQSGGEFVYAFGGPTVGPDDSFVPAHVFKCGDWRIGSFGACSTDTVDAANDCSFATTFCIGDSPSPETCPCDNPGSGAAGCDNQADTGGVSLAVSSFAPDGFGGGLATWDGTNFPAATTPASVLIRASTRTLPTAFSDGLICLDGAVTRVRAGFAIGGSVSITAGHGAGPGAFSYQLWYRSSPAMFCTPAAANISNGVQLDW